MKPIDLKISFIIDSEKRLNELDLSEFNHILSTDNVIDSWSGNTTYTTGQTGNEILYPIADYGYNYNNTTLNGNIEQAINATKLKPAINVKVLIGKEYKISTEFNLIYLRS